MAGLAILLLWAFGAIAEDVPETGFMVKTDTKITAWLQTHGSESGEAIFAAISWLGAPVLTASLVVTTIFLVRKGRRWDAGAVVLAGGGSALLNIALKTIFHRGRPEYASEFIHRASWSFPSGHAMDSLAGYGIMAFLLLRVTTGTRRRIVLTVATFLLVLAIGFSRVYLGVHYLSDVIAGFAAGAVWLIVSIAAYRFAIKRVKPLSNAV